MTTNRPTLTLLDGDRSELEREVLHHALHGSAGNADFLNALDRLAHRASLQVVTATDNEPSDPR